MLSLSFASASPAATINVAAGGDLQAALNQAQPGDVIMLAAGATYVGNFVLPNKGALGAYITVRSNAPDSSLPGKGVRITPAYAALLPKIKSPSSTSALRTAPAANHWRLMFLEFKANLNGSGEIVSLGAGDSTQTELSQVPYALILDRVYIHGDPVLGQKRGIALNSRETTVINSYVSDCKAVGQDSQAIGGWNGPGQYLIENNYLEGAAENFMLGGADPPIPNLVTAGVTFRHNHLSKPMSWRNAIVATPANVAAYASPGDGALPAGTYSYKVVARAAAGQTNKATSVASAEVTAALSATGAVTVSWSPVNGAAEYLVYGRTSGGQNIYWTVTNPYFTDAGAAGTAGTPPKGTKWAVKNLFELKNARNVLVEGNAFENLWVADQPGYSIVFTPRNQNGKAPWTVVEQVTFQHNLVRHAAGGVNILGYDNIAPSKQTNNITIRHNLFDDLGLSWGSGSRPFQMGSGADSVTIDHNTVITDDTAILWLYGGSSASPTPNTNVAFTHNMSAHNAYGIMGSNYSPGLSSINAYLPNGTVLDNVLAGGPPSKYPTGNYFPTVAAWQGCFQDYGRRDYRLLPGCFPPDANGSDMGADIKRINAETAIAISGDNSGATVQILTTLLETGVVGSSYAQTLRCTGGSGAYGWELDGVLPRGLAFDSRGTITGVPSSVESVAITVTAYDAASPANSASQPLKLTVNPPPLSVSLPAWSKAMVGQQYRLAASVSGAVGTITWSVQNGALPPGVVLDWTNGVISGSPTAAGTFTAAIQAQDSWGSNRLAVSPLTIDVASPITITTTSLPGGNVGASYRTTLTATGGSGSATWSIAVGALPHGMSLSSEGVISGTPAAPGTFNITVQAADAAAAGNVASQPLSIAIQAREIVLYAADATTLAGSWSRIADAQAAGASRLWNPDAGTPKIVSPLASPASYVEMTFQAEAGIPYRLWMRGRADRDYWGNDSVFAQFSGSLDAGGAPVFRIGTASGTVVNLEDCSGCGLAGWGWQDNGWGVNVLGPAIYFKRTGLQTIRVQIREDGFSIDQVVLSAQKYFTAPPGALKNDATILGKSGR